MRNTNTELNKALKKFVEVVHAMGDELAGNPEAMVGKLDESRELLEELGYTFHVTCKQCRGKGIYRGKECDNCEGAGNMLPEDV